MMVAGLEMPPKGLWDGLQQPLLHPKQAGTG